MLGKILNDVAVIALVIFASGCNTYTPRARVGTLPTPPPGPRFYEPNNLGRHSYGFSLSEKNGIVFTCKAGHIDITHVRWSADQTRYIIRETCETLRNKGEGFSFALPLEHSHHKIKFSYPKSWDYLTHRDKEKIAEEIAFEVGPYLAFNATIWHEILTWFGVRFGGIEPEFNSSFSWEDMYSNLLGVKIAVEALKDTEHEYDEAMTLAIDNKLKELDAQPRSVAIDAAEKMRGKWFNGRLFVETIRKNMDIGLDDGFVTPVIVPDICDNAVPELLAVPTKNILAKHGFAMKYEICPYEWERDKILKTVYPDGQDGTVEPEKHFPIFMEHIKKQAVKKYTYIID